MKGYARCSIWFFCTLYIATSTIVLPKFHLSEFYFLYRWSLFSSVPEKHVLDYSWDGGKTFLFRDYQSYMAKKEKRKFQKKLFNLTRSLKIERIKNIYKPFFNRISNGRDVALYELKGTLKNHYIDKEELEYRRVVRLDL